MQEDLKKLGLTDNEIKVYLSLLKIGETSVGGIINDLKVHRQIAYNALDSLEKRNMVIKTMKNKIYHFKINDPKIIIENLQVQELIAERLSKNIENKIHEDQHKHEINVYEGREKIRSYFINKYKSAPYDSWIYVISIHTKNFEKLLGLNFISKKYHKIRAQRKIYSKNITTESFKEEFTEFNKNAPTGLRKIKYLPDGMINPISTTIWVDGISFLTFGDVPIMVEIKNKEFRESYLEHFNMLWKIAKM